MISFMSHVRKLAYAYFYISDEAMSEQTATRLFDYVESLTTHGSMYQAIKDFRKDHRGLSLTIDEAYDMLKNETIKDLVSMYSYTDEGETK